MDGDHFEGGVTQKGVVFREGGDVLVVSDPDSAYDWELPGGRVETDETAAEGLRRELSEETGLDATVGRPVLAMRGGWIDADGDALFTVCYHCETPGGAVELNHEHDDYAWLSPARAADAMPFDRLATAVERAAVDRERHS